MNSTDKKPAAGQGAQGGARDTAAGKATKLRSGDFGYIDAHRRLQLLKVILWVVIIAAIVIGGCIYYGDRMNVVTVIGIVLVLPAAKSLVGLVLIWPYHTGDAGQYETVRQLVGDKCIIYSDLVLTRYEGSMAVSIALFHGGNIFAYVPPQKCTPDKIRQYLKQSVKAAGGDATPAVCTDFNKFLEYAKRLADSEISQTKKDAAVAADVLSRAV